MRVGSDLPGPLCVSTPLERPPVQVPVEQGGPQPWKVLPSRRGTGPRGPSSGGSRHENTPTRGLGDGDEHFLRPKVRGGVWVAVFVCPWFRGDDHGSPGCYGNVPTRHGSRGCYGSPPACHESRGVLRERTSLSRVSGGATGTHQPVTCLGGLLRERIDPEMDTGTCKIPLVTKGQKHLSLHFLCPSHPSWSLT